MKQKMFLTAAALVLLFLNLSPAWCQAGVLEELDPNILWVADSSIGRIDGFAVHPNGNVFAYKGYIISEINGDDGKHLRKFNIPNKSISSIDISGDGKYLATAYDGVIITDLITLNSDTVGYGNLVTFNSNSNKIAYAAISYPPSTIGHDSSIVILDLETQQRSYIKTEEMITKIAFSPDGRYFATGGSGQDVFGNSYVSLKLWDANTLELIKELEKLNNSISPSKIKFSNDSKLVGFWISWANLKIFNTETMSILKNYNQTNTNLEISDFAFISDNYIGVQSKKTSIIRLADDYIFNLLDFSARGFMEINKANDILFAGSGKPNVGGSITAWDLKKILSSVEDKSENTTIETDYHKGTLTISGIHSIGNQINIEIFDISGRLVRKLELQTNGEKMKIPLNLTNGTYLIQILDGSQTHAGKFLVVE